MAAGAIVFEGRVRIPADVFDLDKFRRWAHSREFPERGRISFLAGEIDVDMSPEDIETHNKLKTDLTAALVARVRQQDLGDLLGDGAFLVNVEAHLATEPDMMFCSWDALGSGRVRYAEWVKGSNRLVEVIGAPDLVVEIVSRHSVRKDTKLLPKQYFAAGIREFWLIDARGPAIDFQLLVRGKSSFVPAKPDADGYRRSEVMNRRFLLARDRNPVGGFRYTLHDQ